MKPESTNLSKKQRGYYRGCVIPSQLEYYAEHEVDLIRDVLAAVKANLTPEFVHELNKMLFNYSRTTEFKTDIDGKGTAKGEKYYLKIRRHFDINYTHHIPEPNESQWNYDMSLFKE